MKNKIHRRQFIHNASSAFAFAALNTNRLQLFSSPPKQRVALIGTGWYGKSDLFRLMQVAPVDVVALCDPDKNLLNQAATMVMERAKINKKPKLYNDYQKMLAESALVIVLIGTPDHWHALQTTD